jgi:hypothetical protein
MECTLATNVVAVLLFIWPALHSDCAYLYTASVCGTKSFMLYSFFQHADMMVRTNVLASLLDRGMWLMVGRILMEVGGCEGHDVVVKG